MHYSSFHFIVLELSDEVRSCLMEKAQGCKAAEGEGTTPSKRGPHLCG